MKNSDKEILKDMFNRSGIFFKEDVGVNAIEVPSEGGPANQGYNGFITIFEFDEKNMLKSMGAWE